MSESIADGKVVTIHYTLTLDDGSQADSSRGGVPLPYLHGAHNIVPGLESALAGKGQGDSIQVTVIPELGYGPVDSKGLRRVPRSAFPPDLDLTVGLSLFAQDDQGNGMPLVIKELGDDDVLVDMNHPLAGQNLNFDVEVVEVREALEEEIAQGHPNVPDGAEGQ